MENNRSVQLHRIYRHFKGKYYATLALIVNAENDEPMVLYKALYGEAKLYVRTVNNFLTEVDKIKYPTAKQFYRFEVVEDFEK